ncbi:universal stress protein [Chamaesiphon sp. VAR_48_metabat_135_sub]|uniref:universal stress protein n=1 Tax=Chamaesiphon sp. VAR_48_metabat_135_sub TaxID=2964699 RepID=UPI00286AEA58|nr:universal stress protein [Chamaesiphon sp. VAR_48_metabat_135_sub]
MLQRILLAIGDSPDSAQILASGLTLVEKLGAEILILHVLDPLVPHGMSAGVSPLVGGVLPIIDDRVIEQYIQARNERERTGIERLQAYAEQAQDRGIEAEILQNYGDSGPLICEAAKNWAADTILMGRNQKSLLNEIFLGSTSNYVLHHAPCSVMVIQLPALSG